MSSIQSLSEIGERLGLAGDNLVAFIRDQQDQERNERHRQREADKECRDAELQKLDKERDIQFKQLDKELEVARLDQEQRDKDREFELQRMRLEVELELKRKESTAKKKDKKKDEESDSEEQSDCEEHEGHDVFIKHAASKGPKMPPFDDKNDNMDSYLHRFEIYAAAQAWKSSRWAVFLSALLRGKALDVYSRLPVDEAQDYDLLKCALLKRFNLTEEGFKLRFRSARQEAGEAPAQFITRLGSYFNKWVDLSGTTKTFKGLSDLMILDQFIDTCPKDLAIFLKERAVTNLSEVAKLAEQFNDAHAEKSKPTWAAALQSKTDANDENNWRKDSRKCYNCGRIGHIARNCYAPKRTTSGDHKVRAKPERGNDDGPVVSKETMTYQCIAHNQENCSQCLRPVKHDSHAMHAMNASELHLDCGCILPVITDACNTQPGGNMPVMKGKIGNRVVSVLRDTGCSTVVVKRELVDDSRLTGEHQLCILIDGTVRKSPVAQIDIETPYYTGKVTAVCMKRPLYDIILGNIPQIRDTPVTIDAADDNANEAAAVVTRTQLAREKGYKVLTVPSEKDINISPDDLRKLQEADDTLKHLWDQAANKTEMITTPRYVTRQGLLQHKTLTAAGQEKYQVIVPRELRQRVLAIAHDSILGGHQGIRRTYERIRDCFMWPGLHGDVTRYCRSCDICQRTIARGRVPNVPLGNMPIIDTPFQRCAVDLIGPIAPPTERGHRYIVTLVDYATRYPEAAPLKDITAETVAEALVTMFSRVGVPRELLSDQGSQFMSGIMKEASRLLSMRQLVTTPYHPICNGLVERFNGTLKSMLKKMCAEKPRDWDRYIAPLLFAYREAPQESLGFSPFQLLFGRSVRGPMTILRELWTSDNPDPDVKLTYQYVIDLQDRLQETCQLAREQLAKSKGKQTRLYNRKTKERIFKQGDKVLLLLPNNENKLLMQWQGPFEVMERSNMCDYKVQLRDRVRLFHANMLKKYFDRETDVKDIQSTCQTVNAAIVEPAVCEDECGLDLYTEHQTENFSNVDINAELGPQQVNELKQLVSEFGDVFSDIPRVTDLGTHDIKLTSSEPIRGRPYPLPFAMRETVDKEIDTMLKLGIIEKSTAAYASPIVVVKKPDGSSRICIDFRKLNKITIFDPEPMPQADEIFAKLSGSNYFSKFDLSKGYWQVAMNLKDRDFTTFVTHAGLYRFRVMPFGLVNAPATFSRIMRRLLVGSRSLENYLDDVLAHTDTWQEHLEILRDFLTRVRKANMSLRPSKCALGYATLCFLGHVVGGHCIKPNEKTVQKIAEASRPTTKKQLRSFLGLAGYYRRFVPNFAAVAIPLTDLTKKGTPNIIPWSQPQENAFATLKAHISNSPILKLPDFKNEFILQTDASNTGIGAVLLQEESGMKHPVAFASRKLLERERNYSTIERECLAIVWGIQKFEMYLYGKTFALETDHQPLQYLGKAQFQNGRLMRWALALQPYSFVLRSIRGSENVGADFLSRIE